MMNFTRGIRWLTAVAMILILLLITPHELNPGTLPHRKLWPHHNLAFGRQPNHNGLISISLPMQLTRPISWTDPTTGLMQIAVVDGAVYGGTVHSPYAVDKLSALTGRMEWSVSVPNQVMTTPVVYRGVVIVGTGNRDWPGPQSNGIRGTGTNQILGLSANTGKILWSINTPGENMPTPVINNGILYQVGGSDEVLAINPLNGKILQRLPIPSYVSMSSPEIVDHVMYFGGALPYQLYAIDIPHLRIAFTTTLPSSLGGIDDCPPAIADGILVIDYEGLIGNQIHAMAAGVSVHTGRVLWATDLGPGSIPRAPDGSPTNAAGVPIIHGNVVYLGSPVTSTLYALNLRTGKLLWNTSDSGAIGRITMAPIWVNGHIIAGDSIGDIIVVNAKTGRIVSTLKEPTPFVPGVPQIVNGSLFIGTKLATYAIPLENIDAHL
ncbi:PQQ-binding-like beta-propeller repeat protein [Sulfobacillus thermosulfidooxidans]|uniref:outer membrane protein assembly factor BamB family protein n=1 Tax=Sulfobacillus thermosulfidooxidans TaxID=28034 RepID=UPI0006B588A8|nr:PQQ-binding-like beta-propeller repeat protein [Sulfobacillus thermosulfidooxidans]